MIWVPIFVSVISFAVMILGELLSYYSIPLKYKLEIEAFSFGFILGVASLILIPRSCSKYSPVYVVFGMLTVYLIEKISAYCPLSRKYCKECCDLEARRVRYVYPSSFFIHTFIDGVIIAASYIGKIGLPLYLAILIHKFPAGFSLMGPLKGFSKKPLYVGALVSFGTVLGTVIGLTLLRGIPNWIMLAFSGGVFLGAFLMLVPHVHEHKKEGAFLYLMLGFFLAGLISLEYFRGRSLEPKMS